MHSECRQSEIKMTKRDEEQVSELFKMLGEPSRLKIVCALLGTQMCVAHLAEHLGMEQSALSHQLGNLKKARIVKSEKNGKQVFYSLDDTHIYGIIQMAIDHVGHLRGEA